MKETLISTAALLAAASIVHGGQGLYSVGSTDVEPLPLTWSVGLNATWDDNVAPLSGVDDDDAFSINPYVGLSYSSVTPQSTLEVYGRLGAVYYLDEPDALDDDFFSQARVGLNYTHRFNERLRFSSRNFLAYELEPEYAYGFATSRQIGEYLYWQTDNSIGYRWTERFATYTGFTLTQLDYDSNVPSQDRFTWQVYNQFRYQLTPQSLLTFDIRYAETDANGLAADSQNLYLLGGIEHQISPTSIFVLRAGAQFREVDGGDDNTSPYVEASLLSAINDQFSLRGFLRYGLESYDTTRGFVSGPAFVAFDFDQRETLRLGLSGEYAISPMLMLFGGVDYIFSSFDDGRQVAGPVASSGSFDEDLLNLYVGLQVAFTQSIFGTVSYNYTDSQSDFPGFDYDRNRVNVGIRAEF